MASYREIYDLSVSTEFQNRLQIACLACATTISGIPQSDPNYERYMRWARFVFAMPSTARQHAAGFIIMNPKISSGNFTDGDLFDAVSAVIPELLMLAQDVVPRT